MKREDLQRGTIYAHRTGRGTYDRSRPVRLVDDRTPWQLNKGVYSPAQSTRPSIYGAKAGYLAVTCHARHEDAVRQLQELELPELYGRTPAAEALRAFDDSLPKGVYLVLVSGQQLPGPWDEVHAREEQQAQERQRASEERDAFWSMLHQRVAAHGVSVRPSLIGGQVEISVEDLLKLLDAADR